jgi:hypothetical protein
MPLADADRTASDTEKTSSGGLELRRLETALKRLV